MNGDVVVAGVRPAWREGADGPTRGLSRKNLAAVNKAMGGPRFRMVNTYLMFDGWVTAHDPMVPDDSRDGFLRAT